MAQTSDTGSTAAPAATTSASGGFVSGQGMGEFRASKFVGVKFSRAMIASFPIYVIFLAAIVFCIFFPEVVLWLPRQLLPQSVGCFANPSGSGYICP